MSRPPRLARESETKLLAPHQLDRSPFFFPLHTTRTRLRACNTKKRPSHGAVRGLRLAAVPLPGREMRRPAPPARLCGGLRRRLRRHGAPPLGGARRARVGVVLVGQEGRPGHYWRRRHPGAPWPAGARQHGAHDGPSAPEARGGGGRRRQGPAPAHGVLARRDPRRGHRRPRRRAGAPGQLRLRRPPHQGVRVRAPLPPRHRLRPARRLLARAPPRRLLAPLLAAPDRRLGRAARRDRAPDGRRHGGRGGRRRRDRDRDGAAVPEARVAAQRDVVGVRPEVRAAGGQRGGGGAQEPGGRRVRPPRPAQLVRPPPLARPLRPAEDPGPVLRPRPPCQPLRRPHHRRAPCPARRPRRRRRHRRGLHRRPAVPPGQRQALRRRHDRRPLGDDLSRHGHGGGSDGVGAGPSGAAPGRAAPGPRGAGPGGGRQQQAGGRRDGVGHRLPRLPPGGRQGGAAPAPAGPTPLLGAPRHVGRPRGRVPRTRGDHRHGEHVGHHPRPGRLARPGRVQTGEVRGGGGRRRRGRDVPDHGVGPEARAVRVRQAELPRQVPRDGHRRVLARHSPARVRVAAGGVRRLRRRRPGRSAEAVVRDGRPAGGEAGATSPRGRELTTWLRRQSTWHAARQRPSTTAPSSSILTCTVSCVTKKKCQVSVASAASYVVV